jgi:hypothetical protein
MRGAVVSVLLLGFFFVPASPTIQAAPALTYADRVAAQTAIEKVYWEHRIWPEENPGPKPPLEEVISEAEIRAKVDAYAAASEAMESFWKRPITPAQLQAEMDRMVLSSWLRPALKFLCASSMDAPVRIPSIQRSAA